jgi:hypothetical protein
MPSTQTRRNLNTAFVGTGCASDDEDVRRGSDVGATLDKETKEAPPSTDPGISSLYVHDTGTC